MNERDLLQSGFRYALSLRHAQADAEDLVQEAWLRLHRKSGRVASRSLLFTTIRNLYLDQYRRERLIAFAPLDEVAEPANVEPLLDDRVSARDLEAPLAALRPEEREALYLHAVEGYTAQEIAGLTMRARGTVLSLLHRAKRKLAKAIAAGGDRPAPRRQAG